MIDDWITGLLGHKWIMQGDASRGQKGVGQTVGDLRRIVIFPFCGKLL